MYILMVFGDMLNMSTMYEHEIIMSYRTDERPS